MCVSAWVGKNRMRKGFRGALFKFKSVVIKCVEDACRLGLAQVCLKSQELVHSCMPRIGKEVKR